MELDLRLIPPDELQLILPLAKIQNRAAEESVLALRLGEMVGQGYQCLGAWHQGQLIGICGFWITTRFYSGKQIEADNVIVLPEFRSQGVGQQLMAWLEAYGQQEGCLSCELSCYTASYRAHRFYMREGFIILGYRFQKPLPFLAAPGSHQLDGETPGR
jgi:GNAT superfamily N-acetyltransferase